VPIEGRHERLGKVPVELHRVQRSLELAGLVERVELRLKRPRCTDDLLLRLALKFRLVA
jgi:hypothetical protein